MQTSLFRPDGETLYIFNQYVRVRNRFRLLWLGNVEKSIASLAFCHENRHVIFFLWQLQI